MSIYVMEKAEIDEDLDAALVGLINYHSDKTRDSDLADPKTTVEPHIDLCKIIGSLHYFRQSQRNLEYVVAEASPEDERINDIWLTLSSAGLAMDSIIEQLYDVMLHYTKVIIDIGEEEGLYEIISKTANTLVEENQKPL